MGLRGPKPRVEGVSREKLSSSQRGFGALSVSTETKTRFVSWAGARTQDEALSALLDGAGPVAPGSPVDWDGLRLALKQRLKLAGTAVLDDVLKEYGMPSE